MTLTAAYAVFMLCSVRVLWMHRLQENLKHRVGLFVTPWFARTKSSAFFASASGSLFCFGFIMSWFLLVFKALNSQDYHKQSISHFETLKRNWMPVVLMPV